MALGGPLSRRRAVARRRRLAASVGPDGLLPAGAALLWTVEVTVPTSPNPRLFGPVCSGLRPEADELALVADAGFECHVHAAGHLLRVAEHLFIGGQLAFVGG
jgi:hypothetical protein